MYNILIGHVQKKPQTWQDTQRTRSYRERKKNGNQVKLNKTQEHNRLWIRLSSRAYTMRIVQTHTHIWLINL